MSNERQFDMTQPGGMKFSETTSRYSYAQLFTPESAGLQWLGCGLHRLKPGGRSPHWAHAREEALLFHVSDAPVTVEVDGRPFVMNHYDSLYIPLGKGYAIRSDQGGAALYEFTAAAENVHPVYHSKWDEFRRVESRIRRLKGKDVYLMFDVSEKADKLVAGYTFFQKRQRGWPIHNHTDQEECYLFIDGRGAMEVFHTEEEKTFVTSVEAGDAVTIPFLAYHPPFSQDDEMTFIWCIAGARYWVGDRSAEFLRGEGKALTT
ncbi:MAG: 5-deoxy-glucuronate isomerase [Candidatus Sumerlaeota bacterium]|nr:5-deoxy-glucuronate isomerase [Candidatus Sumerlaeota bacterium]